MSLTHALFLIFSIFFESITWDEGEVGFEKVPGGDDYTNRSVLAWHFYQPPMVGIIIAVCSLL